MYSSTPCTKSLWVKVCGNREYWKVKNYQFEEENKRNTTNKDVEKHSRITKEDMSGQNKGCSENDSCVNYLCADLKPIYNKQTWCLFHILFG